MNVVIIRTSKHKEERIQRAIDWFVAQDGRPLRKFDDIRTQDLSRLCDTIILVENKYYKFSAIRRKCLWYIMASTRPRNIIFLVPILLQPREYSNMYLDKRIVIMADAEIRCYLKNFLWIRDLRTRAYKKVNL